MLEKLVVLERRRRVSGRGYDYPERVTIGAEPLSSDQDEQTGGTVETVGDSIRLRIARTPATEEHVNPTGRVRWRGEQWTVRLRVEIENRTRYELTLERSA